MPNKVTDYSQTLDFNHPTVFDALRILEEETVRYEKFNVVLKPTVTSCDAYFERALEFLQIVANINATESFFEAIESICSLDEKPAFYWFRNNITFIACMDEIFQNAYFNMKTELLKKFNHDTDFNEIEEYISLMVDMNNQIIECAPKIRTGSQRMRALLLKDL